jgi:hypothetical protein
MPPFYSRTRQRLFDKILRSELRIPPKFSMEARSLLEVPAVGRALRRCAECARIPAGPAEPQRIGAPGVRP